MAETSIDIGSWRGRHAVDPRGSSLGTIEDIYYEDEGDQALFLLLKSGLFGSRRRFVPAQGAREWGEQVVVAYDEDLVKGAPGIEADGELTVSEEDELYRHYGIAGIPGAAPETAPPPEPAAAAQPAATDAAGVQEPVTGGAAAPAEQAAEPTDDAMTRSEEELRIVGHETRPRERVRLKKYKVTDYVTMRVPVTREEVRVEREPVAPAEGERVVEPLEDDEAR